MLNATCSKTLTKMIDMCNAVIMKWTAATDKLLITGVQTIQRNKQKQFLILSQTIKPARE